MVKKYANIRLSLDVKEAIDQLSKDFGSADNVLRGLLGLPLTAHVARTHAQTIPMQLMIGIVLKMLENECAMSRNQLVQMFESKLIKIPENFKKDRQVLSSNLRPRWYSKLGNAIQQGRKSGLITVQEDNTYSGKALWMITEKGRQHLSRTEPLVVQASRDPSSSFILNLLK